MKQVTRYTIGTILSFALSGAAWAQQPPQRDLEVTMDVVPANASAGAATGEIKLPITLPDTSRAREASAFGLDTANSARDLGSAFGQAVSEAARTQDRTPNIPSK